jgi:Ca2+-binding EF-hand superfamily protein
MLSLAADVERRVSIRSPTTGKLNVPRSWKKSTIQIITPLLKILDGTEIRHSIDIRLITSIQEQGNQLTIDTGSMVCEFVFKSGEVGGFTDHLRLLSKTIPKPAQLLMDKWKEQDKDNSGKLSFDEAMSVMEGLRANCSTKVLRQKFALVDADGSKSLDLFEFETFVRSLYIRVPLDAEFRAITPEFMTVEQFQQFCKQVQCEDVPEERVRDLFSKFKRPEFECPPGTIDICAFCQMLCSPEVSHPVNARVLEEKQDMHHPLAHYFISSTLGSCWTGPVVKSFESPELQLFIVPAEKVEHLRPKKKGETGILKAGF